MCGGAHLNETTSNDACGVLLAGAHRWSESQIERLCPQPLLPVGGSPLIAYGLRWLRDAGVSRVAICANSASAQVRRCLSENGNGAGGGFDLYFYEDETPRGPAGCIRDACLDLSGRDVIAIEGSLIPTVSLAELLQAHRERDSDVTIAVTGGGDAQTPGRRRLRPIGLYVFARRALERIPAAGYQDLKETLLPALHRAGARIDTWTAAAEPIQARDLAGYLRANATVAHWISQGRIQLDGYEPRGSASVHRTAEIAADARVVGPVVVAAGCVVGRGAILVGPLVLGENCRIGARAVASRSVLWESCVVGADARVDRSVLTSEARVAARLRIYGTIHSSAPSAGERQTARPRRRAAEALNALLTRIPSPA